jgi:predicted Rossmann-fold nucleotide-binding protein
MGHAMPLRPSCARCHPVAAVIGSGRTADACCADVGRLIATLGFHLLTGGGRGVMEAVSRAFYETSPRSGLVIGIIPAEVHGLDQIENRTAADIVYEPPAGYPNKWVEIAIFTHLPDSGEEGTLRSSRNHINVLSAHVIVALPGRAGTESEIWLAKQYGVPIIAYGDHADGVPHGIETAPSLEAVRAFLLKHQPR